MSKVILAPTEAVEFELSGLCFSLNRPTNSMVRSYLEVTEEPGVSPLKVITAMKEFLFGCGLTQEVYEKLQLGHIKVICNNLLQDEKKS